MFTFSLLGSIRIKQAKYAMQSLGLQVNKEEIRPWLPVDKDGTSDMIDLVAFTQMAGSMIVVVTISSHFDDLMASSKASAALHVSLSGPSDGPLPEKGIRLRSSSLAMVSHR